MQYEAAAELPANAVSGDDLVREALANRTAFEAIYLRYRDAVFGYLRSQTRSAEDAADLTALTFQRALERLSSFRGEGAGLSAWLFRIARNLAADQARRRRPMRPIWSLTAREEPSTTITPEAEVLGRESSRRLAARLNELAPLARECLVLRYAAGLSAREIAAVIGRSEAATQKQLSRALARLKEAYRDER